MWENYKLEINPTPCLFEVKVLLECSHTHSLVSVCQHVCACCCAPVSELSSCGRDCLACEGSHKLLSGPMHKNFANLCTKKLNEYRKYCTGLSQSNLVEFLTSLNLGEICMRSHLVKEERHMVYEFAILDH